MFTGIVETIGTVIEYTEVDSSESGGNGVSMVIGDASVVLEDVHLGDSISTSGVCLTVTEFNDDKTQFKVGISPETLRRSNLGELKVGSRVNLERAVNSEVRLGGHVVQGHVDTIATITERVNDGNAINFTFQLRDKQNINYVVEKGFIAVDGVSLTVTHVDYTTGSFSISMVAYTQSKVIISDKQVGDSVNIEVDFTGKLIEKQIELTLSSQIKNQDSSLSKLISNLIEEKLQKLNK